LQPGGAKAGATGSKYQEDVYINNHTQIWGSYWENGQWGFACCRQTVKNSYCTGKAGLAAKENMIQFLIPIHSKRCTSKPLCQSPRTFPSLNGL